MKTRISLIFGIGPLAALFAVCANSAMGQTNDYCTNAIAMEFGTNYTLNTLSATSSSDPAPNCISSLGRGVWFTFTPPISERVTISTCGSDFDTGLAVYTGTCGTFGSTPLACDDDNGPSCVGINASLSFGAVAGTKYYLLAGGYGGGGGNLQVIATATPPPFNDTCTNAIPMTLGQLYLIDTMNATETGDPVPCCVNIGRSVWYTFTPQITERVTISTCGSDFDTVLAVYTGTCGAFGNPIYNDDNNGPACASLNASVNFSATAGTTYYIQAGGNSQAGGNLEIMATATPPPFNDTCTNAIAMTLGQIYLTNTIYATETGDPVPCCVNIGRSVWYTFTPQITERVTISTCGSDFDTVLEVYTGTCGAFGNPIYNDDNNGPACASLNASVNFSATAGTTYYIQAGGNSQAGGNLEIMATATPPPFNDTCTNAIPMTLGQLYLTNTINATETGDPVPCCVNIGRSVWYTFTPQITERVTISTCGSDFDTVLEVYTGTCGAFGNPIYNDDNNGPACASLNASVNFSATAGTTYYIQAGGNSQAGGNLEIMATATPPPFNDTCTNALAMTLGQLYLTNTINATETGDPVPCCVNIGRSVWYTFTPQITERVTISTCGSDFDTVLEVYTGTCGAFGNPIYSDDNNGPACASLNASVNFSATAGTTYYIQAGGNSQAGGNLEIMATATPPPFNDTCTNAIAMTPGQFYLTNTIYATETGDPVPCCANIGRSVWYTFFSPVTQQVTITTCGSDFDTVLEVYTGTCGAFGSPIYSNDNDGPACAGKTASVNFSATAGTTYFIQAGGNAQAGGNLHILADIGLPANNNCSNAVTMVPGTTYLASTFNATEASDPTNTCASNFGRGVWYQYTPANTGPVGITTCGSDFDAALAVFTGTCGSFSPVSCSHTNGAYCTSSRASLNFDGVAGTNYFILAGGNNRAAGNLQIMIPLLDLAATGINATNPLGGFLAAGRNISAGWKVSNLGTNSINGYWTDRLSLSNATTQVVLAEYSGPHNAPAGGSYSNFSQSIPLPQIPVGTYSLIAETDASHEVVETNEINNRIEQSIFITNIAPSVTLLSPTNSPVTNVVSRTVCLPELLSLAAAVQPGSYNIARVDYHVGTNSYTVTNGTQFKTNAFIYYGTNLISAEVVDIFGVRGTSAVSTTIVLDRPDFHTLIGQQATNKDCVFCMGATPGSNYVVEYTTNLQSPVSWQTYVTNLPISGTLFFTNTPILPRRFFRAGRLP